MDLHRFEGAVARLNSGQVVEALRELTALAESTPDPGEKAMVLANASMCYQILGDLSKARQYWQKARDVQPNDEAALYLAFQDADLCWFEGKHEEAFEKMETLWKNHADTLRLLIHRNLYELIQTKRGVMLAQFDRFGEALPVIEEALTFEMKDLPRGDLHFSLGLSYLGIGKMEEAETNFLTAIGGGVQSAYAIRAHYCLGIIHSRRGAYERALQEFEYVESRADEGGIGNDKVYGWLARTCRMLGLHAEAQRYDSAWRHPQ